MKQPIRSARRGLDRCLAVAALAASAGCGAAPEGGATTDETGESQQALGPEFTAMTFNVRMKTGDDKGERDWFQREPNMIRMLSRYMPHVLGLQEVRREVAEQFYNKIHALGSYNKFLIIDRGDGEGLGIMWRTDRFTHVETNFRSVTNDQRDGDCGWSDKEEHINRPIMMVKLRDLLTGFQYYVYNTHWPAANSCERHGMARIMDSFIDTRTDPTAPVIVLGDFNDGIEANGRHNGSFQRFLDLTGHRSSYALHHALNTSSNFLTGHAYNKTARQGRMIDHVTVSHPSLVIRADVDYTMFTSGGVAVPCARVTNGLCPNGMRATDLRLYSDHWATWAVLRQ